VKQSSKSINPVCIVHVPIRTKHIFHSSGESQPVLFTTSIVYVPRALTSGSRWYNVQVTEYPAPLIAKNFTIHENYINSTLA